MCPAQRLATAEGLQVAKVIAKPRVHQSEHRTSDRIWLESQARRKAQFARKDFPNSPDRSSTGRPPVRSRTSGCRGWSVTRGDALRALDDFVADCMPGFGDYQDAIKAGEDFLFHRLISTYLNCGLLTARGLRPRLSRVSRRERADQRGGRSDRPCLPRHGRGAAGGPAAPAEDHLLVFGHAALRRGPAGGEYPR